MEERLSFLQMIKYKSNLFFDKSNSPYFFELLNEIKETEKLILKKSVYFSLK